LLDKNREGTAKTAEVIEKLLMIRQQLVDIRNEMAENETENNTE
jgi:hypothetical protein